MSPEQEPKLDFEAALVRLDAIVKELESGDVALERAIALFEEGLQLGTNCSKLLEGAEMRVQKLLERADGSAEVQSMAPKD